MMHFLMHHVPVAAQTKPLLELMKPFQQEPIILRLLTCASLMDIFESFDIVQSTD